MKIATISDTHWKFDEIEVPECDVLLHAGDVSGRGRDEEITAFLDWYASRPATYKVLIAGNHDFGFEKKPEWCEEQCKKRGIIYLNDSGTTIKDFDTGEEIKIWGSPVQPEFCNWAFNRSRTEREASSRNAKYYGHTFIGVHWDMIPKDTDILITHGPAKDILDQCSHGEKVGCDLLAKKILEVKPKLHVSGHIHEARGVHVDHDNNITYVNAASLNLQYNPWKDKTFVFDYKKLKSAASLGRDYE